MGTAAESSSTEHLTTGWEPDLDPGDTLVRHYTFGLAASAVSPVRALGGRVLESAGVIASDLGRPAAVHNAAVLTRPPGADGADGWDATLATIEAFYVDGTGQVYLFSPFPTPDLRDRGWHREGHPPLLVRPPGAPLPAVPADLTICEVTDRRGLTDFQRVVVDGFPFTDMQPFTPDAWLDERVLHLPGHRLFVGYVDGVAVTCGWVFVQHGLGVLVLGVTLPDYRGRGYWSAMLRRRLDCVGDRPVASLLSDDSRPIAERHYGFLPVVRFTAWRWHR